tara:strand:+ start:391 stop:663 length:273 start_codon:yes stop_codon:yes gene_type:complete
MEVTLKSLCPTTLNNGDHFNVSFLAWAEADGFCGKFGVRVRLFNSCNDLYGITTEEIRGFENGHGYFLETVERLGLNEFTERERSFLEGF